jgi:hypothetical protein
MQRHRLLILFGSLVALIGGLPVARALASTPFAITATNVTMPSSGNGVSNYTITGIPAPGTVTIGCLFSGTITTARIPTCTYGPITSIPVTADQALTGTIEFYPFGVAVPVELHRTPRRSGHLPAAGGALAGALMLGFGARRRRWRWLALAVFALGALGTAGGMIGCGGVSTSMTPGTYQYTITASYEASGTAPLGRILSTNIEVTVP